MNNAREYLDKKLNINEKIYNYVAKCEKDIKSYFDRIDDIAEFNQYKVTSAFISNEVSERHFNPSTGYGYSDDSKTKLCEVFATVFNTDAAIVSPLLMSGTHAITVALFGLLKPGDTLLCISGNPYDTFNDVLNGKNGDGSLKEWGINNKVIDLKNDTFDTPEIISTINNDSSIKLIHIQKSRGYDTRCTISCAEISSIVKEIRRVKKEIVIFVDNCYGEFTERIEPTEVGANICAGSLIKNPGGGIAPSGGYIVGERGLIDRIANRYSAPGIGMEIGSYAHSYKEYFQGIFMAPHIVKEALKGSILISNCMQDLNIEVLPKYDEERFDITQSVIFNDEKLLTEFIRGIQMASPVDSSAVPYAWDMPGYEDQVIMAAGTFVQGATLELSADGPIREPYAAYVQGGLTYENVKLGLMTALNNMGIIK